MAILLTENPFYEFAIILSLAALLGAIDQLLKQPLIVLIIMGIMGYRKRTAFLAGLTVAQTVSSH